jgi:hypothetical protein
LGRVIMSLDGWQRGILGGPHHMGTTRMSADPRHGVIDVNCRVHSVDKSVRRRFIGLHDRRLREPDIHARSARAAPRRHLARPAEREILGQLKRSRRRRPRERTGG